MIRDVDPEVHKRFRVWCIENETSMNKQLLKLVTEFVQNLEADKDKKK